jgi:hypothetical protein
MHQRRRREAGIAMVFSLIVVALLSTLGFTMVSRSMGETNLSARSASRQGAFFLAEAAIDHAIGNLGADNTSHIPATSLPGGSYWAEVVSLGNQQYRITGHGLVGSDQRDVEAVIQRSSQSVFQYALFGYSEVEIKNGAFTDSYNSTQGNYDPASPGSKGNIGTNSTGSNDVTLDNGAAVNGQVAVGPGLADPGSVVDIKNGAVITGTPPVVSATSALSAPAVVPPPGPCDAKLKLKNGDTATLVQALSPYCYSEVELDNGATLSVSGQVELYTGKLIVKNSSSVNYSAASKPAPNLIVQITSTNKVDIDNSAKFVGAIYAPNSEATLKNSSIFFSAVISSTARIRPVEGPPSRSVTGVMRTANGTLTPFGR